MEPFQARLTLLAFLTLSGFTVFNALYLQADPGVRARLPRSVATASGMPSLHSQPARVHPLAQAVKRHLDERGYFTEGGDAILIGAVMAYQYDNGLVVDGTLSDELMKTFVFGVERSQDGEAKAPAVEGETARRLVAEVQGILSGQGYYGDEIDGLQGTRTADAIRRFETDRGLPVTGRVSGLLLQELARRSGVEFSGRLE
jgi:peptidoglycan hydrolase-like protein with peptidoglycan-binding domain